MDEGLKGRESYNKNRFPLAANPIGTIPDRRTDLLAWSASPKKLNYITEPESAAMTAAQVFSIAVNFFYALFSLNNLAKLN